MENLKVKIPYILIISRIIIGLIILKLSLLENNREFINTIIFLLILGILTDIFDGIIARHLHSSTKMLRRLDTQVDNFFWTISVISVFQIFPDKYSQIFYLIYIVVILEFLNFFYSFYKFRKEVCTHSILAKLWDITILIMLISILIKSNPNTSIYLCFIIGLFTQIDKFLTTYFLKEWINDIPSCLQAFNLLKGKEIKRNKYLNG